MCENAPESTISDSPTSRVFTLGHHLGYRVRVAVRREPPDARAPDEFAVNVFVSDPNGENVDIVRIDTGHDGVHADRFYLPNDDPRRLEDYGLTVHSPEEALRYLHEASRWQRFLNRYDCNHGLPMRTGRP
jgi:hypothetical protein